MWTSYSKFIIYVLGMEGQNLKKGQIARILQMSMFHMKALRNCRFLFSSWGGGIMGGEADKGLRGLLQYCGLLTTHYTIQLFKFLRISNTHQRKTLTSIKKYITTTSTITCCLAIIDYDKPIQNDTLKRNG